jgi:hypothetical protein
MTDNTPSRERLRALLAADPGPRRMFLTEATYHAQVEYTRQLLDVVDQVADPATAVRITDAIYNRLAAEGASEAVERAREAEAEYERLMSEDGLRARRLALLRYTRDHGGYMSPEAKADLARLEAPGS